MGGPEIACTSGPIISTPEVLWDSLQDLNRSVNSLHELLDEIRGNQQDEVKGNNPQPPMPSMLEVYKGSSARIIDESSRIRQAIDQLRDDLLR